jgi:predicted metal-dependent hydrolase
MMFGRYNRKLRKAKEAAPPSTELSLRQTHHLVASNIVQYPGLNFRHFWRQSYNPSTESHSQLAHDFDSGPTTP